MISTIPLSMVDGVRVVVPDSLDLITPYVLREQQDWFEDELRFLRILLQPGQNVIDIGANYGVYALSMAKKVGPSGRVWAFEPASETAGLLAESIAINGFTQITLERKALSSASGTAQLSLNKNSELNALVRDASAGASETVQLTTLDECLDVYGWRDVEFMKIDAEGEEGKILEGGKRFFAELSPMVQYEVKSDEQVQMEVVRAFAALGYDSYRLVPGLDVLVPFDAGALPDGFLLNLFCCKPDRAAILAGRGFLLRQPARDLQDDGDLTGCRWRDTLRVLPYGAVLDALWEQTTTDEDHDDVEQALAFYARSRDSLLSKKNRFAALENSFNRFSTLCARSPSHLRLASLARVARDYGARAVAVASLHQQARTIIESGGVQLNEPFLAPGERFDTLPPGDALGRWVLAGVLEEVERLSAHSSYYSDGSNRERLHLIRDLGFGSAEMERRLSLLQQRHGAVASA
jgi:FkbM family methyltransferase